MIFGIGGMPGGSGGDKYKSDKPHNIPLPQTDWQTILWAFPFPFPNQDDYKKTLHKSRFCTT